MLNKYLNPETIGIHGGSFRKDETTNLKKSIQKLLHLVVILQFF